MYLYLYISVVSAAAVSHLAASAAPTAFTDVDSKGMTHHYSSPDNLREELSKCMDTLSDAKFAETVMKQKDGVMGLHFLHTSNRVKYIVGTQKALPDPADDKKVAIFGSASNNPAQDKPALLSINAAGNVYVAVKQSDLPDDSQLPKGKDLDKTSCPLLASLLQDDATYHI